MQSDPRVGILWRGNREARSQATAENNRFSPVFTEFVKCGFRVEPAVYDDAFVDDVRLKLNEVDGVLVS